MSELRPRTLELLVDGLDSRGAALGDWSARAREVERFELDGDGGVRALRRLDMAARVHVDGPTGRGSAELALEGGLTELEPEMVSLRLDDAIARAVVSIGPGWRAAPPAAPARVRVGVGAGIDPETTARALLAALTDAAGRERVELVEVRASVERAIVLVETSRGLATRWTETLLGVEAWVAEAGVTARVADRTRTRRAIDPGALVADAARRARLRAGAGEAPAGVHPVLVPAVVLGHDGIALVDALGALADATLHRQGLARVGVGHRIAAGADTVEDPLSLFSDGTVRNGLRSAPLGDHGEPVRRFPIVERGVLVGLALDEREGALRGIPANGGVRNLVVAAGTADAAALRGDGVLELLEVGHVDVEPLTGHGAIGVGLAMFHQGGAARPVTGGELQGDLVAAFARARRSRELVRAGPYVGPSLVRLPDLHLV